MQTTPAILALSLLEAVQNIDTPPDDGLGALEYELASKRLGLSATVAAQVARYRERADAGGDLPEDEALAVFRLVGRRPDAALVYSDAGRRAARYAARREGSGSRTLRSLLPGKLAARFALRTAGRLSRRWLLIELRADGGAQARAEATDSLGLRAREDGQGCQFYSAALAELLRIVVGFEGVVTHESCRGRGDRSCRWLAAKGEGYE
jgi:hypothetical protein